MLKSIVIFFIFFSYSFSDTFFIGAYDSNKYSNIKENSFLDNKLIGRIILNKIDILIRFAVYKKEFTAKIIKKHDIHLYEYIEKNYKKVNKFIKLKGYSFEIIKKNDESIYIIGWHNKKQS